jgi:hypothetical protein
MFQEGQNARVSFEDFTVENATTGVKLKAVPVPPALIEMLRRGGMFPLLESEGLIAPKQADETGKEAAQQ